MLQRFVFNLTGAEPRREMLEGRPHLVAEGAMLGEEVIPGSDGPILYLNEENGKNPEMWNAKPIVVYHPKMGDTYISARDPEIFNTQKVGLIFNTRQDDKLRTECWFDEEKTKEVDKRVYTAVMNGEQLEISTGLDMDMEDKKGEHNGKPYIGIARNYRPDHLAVLPDKKGAYSVAMGGGLFANEAVPITTANKKWNAAARKAHPLSDFGEPSKRGFPIEDQQDLEDAASLLHHAADPTAVKKRLIAIARRKGLKLPESWSKTANDASTMESSCPNMTHEMVRGQLHSQLGAKFGDKGKSWNGWIEDVFPQSVVYSTQGGTYKHDYAPSGKNAVALKGDPVKVVRTTDYKPVTNSSSAEEIDNMAFDKKAHITSLIGNGWEETDRVTLDAMDDKVLAKIKPEVKGTSPPATPSVTPTITGNNDTTPPATQPKNLDDWMKSVGAPPELVKQVKRGLKANESQKTALVKKILANKSNPFSEEFLKEKEIEELQGLVVLSTAPTANEDEDDITNGGMFRSGNYSLAPGGPVVANAADMDAPLVMPEIDYSK